MAHTRKLWFLVLMMLALLVSACANDKTPDMTKQPENPPATEQQSPVKPPNGQGAMRLTVYYATQDAMNLVPEVHAVEKNDHPAKTAIELLLAEPSNKQLVRVLPAGTKLKSLAVRDHIAYVDFNDKIVKNNGGGSATEILIVAGIVNTLTEFPDIHKVQILVEGKTVETLNGHMSVGEPLSRSEGIIKKM
jgi:spore germination protein GerM